MNKVQEVAAHLKAQGILVIDLYPQSDGCDAGLKLVHNVSIQVCAASYYGTEKDEYLINRGRYNAQGRLQAIACVGRTGSITELVTKVHQLMYN